MIRPIERNDFFAGRWQEHLEKILQQPEEWKSIDLNGADKAADTIATILDE